MLEPTLLSTAKARSTDKGRRDVDLSSRMRGIRSDGEEGRKKGRKGRRDEFETGVSRLHNL